MTDVAARAAVSSQTVSRVLNEPTRVKPSTRERVETAIAELGFTRNRAARALKTTRSSIIGVLTDGSALYGPAATTAAIEAAAHSAGYATLLSTVSTDGDGDGRKANELMENGADGIIVVAPHDGMLPTVRAIARTAPIVSVSAGALDIERVTSVGVDQARGAREVVEYLAHTGYRSVVHLQGPTSWFDARERVAGFLEAGDELGLATELSEPADWSAEAGYAFGERLLRGALPDAVFAANDLMALGLLHVLHRHGVVVPKDIAIVGFDDISGAKFFTPPLSTVRQPFKKLGRTAVEQLLAGMGSREHARPDLAPELIVRESSRPLT